MRSTCGASDEAVAMVERVIGSEAEGRAGSGDTQGGSDDLAAGGADLKVPAWAELPGVGGSRWCGQCDYGDSGEEGAKSSIHFGAHFLCLRFWPTTREKNE